MSDEQRSTGDTGLGFAAAGEPINQPVSDEHTTEPNAPQQTDDTVAAASSGKWQMPKPKFQQSSGYLPQGYLKDIEAAALAATGPHGSEDTTQEQAPFVPESAGRTGKPAPVEIDIEPQPDLSEQLVPDEPILSAAAEVPKEKSGSSTLLIVLGLLGIVLFIAAFIAVVYFLFFVNPVDKQLG